MRDRTVIIDPAASCILDRESSEVIRQDRLKMLTRIIFTEHGLVRILVIRSQIQYILNILTLLRFSRALDYRDRLLCLVNISLEATREAIVDGVPFSLATGFGTFGLTTSGETELAAGRSKIFQVDGGFSGTVQRFLRIL